MAEIADSSQCQFKIQQSFYADSESERIRQKFVPGFPLPANCLLNRTLLPVPITDVRTGDSQGHNVSRERVTGGSEFSLLSSGGPVFPAPRQIFNNVNPMRFITGFLLLSLTGCQSLGLSNPFSKSADCQSFADCQNGQCTADCQPGAHAENCPNWICAHGYCAHGKHPHYHRMPDNIWTKSSARKRAQADLKCLSKNQRLSCDYRLGYEQAYVDVSLGSAGEVPVLPPPNYWKQCARSPEGHEKAQQWFSGYAAGSAHAKSIYEPFNKVAHSSLDCENWDPDASTRHMPH